MKNLRRPLNLVAEIAAEIFGRSHFDLASVEQLGEFELQPGDRKEPRRRARLELNQKIDVARIVEGVSESRTKQRELRYPCTGAEIG
jgi:hypothetical protein